MPMIDPDLPAYFFECHTCGAAIPDPDKGFAEPMHKGGGFTSMKQFCTQECADSTTVEAALKAMESNDGPQLDVNGDVVYPHDDVLTAQREEKYDVIIDEFFDDHSEDFEDGSLTKQDVLDSMKDKTKWGPWQNGVSQHADYSELVASYDHADGTVTIAWE